MQPNTQELFKISTIKRSGLSLGIAACLIGTIALAETPATGKYEINLQIDNPTLALSESQSSTHCITANEFTMSPSAFLSEQQQGDKCQVHDYTMSGGHISLDMVCAMAGGKTTVRGEGEYTEQTFTLTNNMTMEIAGLQMAMKTIATGKRVGDC